MPKRSFVDELVARYRTNEMLTTMLERRENMLAVDVARLTPDELREYVRRTSPSTKPVAENERLPL